MNKYERIQLVRKFHLNTEDSILVTPQTDPSILLRFTSGVGEVSIRTMDPVSDARATPHYPIVDVHDMPARIIDILNTGLYVIVAKPINPKDCELAGAIWKQGSTMFIELANGPCTTRRVTFEGIIDHLKEYPTDLITDKRMLAMVKQVKEVPISRCIVELSYYSIPVGYKHENVIIWEITGDGTKESDAEVASYIGL